MKKPLVDKRYTIKKQPSKGGWTYVAIPGISASKIKGSGLIRVRGRIDSYELEQYNLLPMKNGSMLLPLKTSVRKKIGKKEGDTVRVVLYIDESPVVVPDDIWVCLMDAPRAHHFFLTLSESNKKYYIDWIEEPKKFETKISRIVKTIQRLENRLKFYDW